MNNEEAVIVILKDHINFMGTDIYPPFGKRTVQDVFGEGRYVLFNPEINVQMQVWDELGIFGWLNKDGTEITAFAICLNSDKRNPPIKNYTGKIMIGKKNYQECSWKFDNYSCQELKQGSFRLSTLLPDMIPNIENQDIAALLSSRVEIDYIAPKAKKPEKYTQHKLKEPALEFENFNFKLAVIQKLMYEKNLLNPKFDVYEFAQEYKKRKIDVDEEGYDIIREAKEWFIELQIPERFAAEVTELVMDGGNEIYMQIIPFWDGESDVFDLNQITEDEIRQFPNLRHITLMTSDIENVLPVFNKCNVKAELL
ncbi:MAG: hypothetical protein J6D08_10855 [Lachnospiraceae bacterium]|nr:hypothetical protein [Lachnospiraceae bacterium]